MKITEIDGYGYDENGECVYWDADRPDPPGFVNPPVPKCADVGHVWANRFNVDDPMLVRTSEFCIRCSAYKVSH